MTQPFTVILPEMVTDENLLSINVPENDHPVYSPVAQYNLGDRVILTTGFHMIYESLSNNNTQKFPPDFPNDWVEVGPTNAWAAFDDSGGTQVIVNDLLEFEISNVSINSIAFLATQAKTIRVQALLDNLVIFDSETTLQDTANIQSWYDYFTAQPIINTEKVIFDVPNGVSFVYKITITNTGQVRLGNYVMGIANRFGFTQYNATVGIKNFGKTEVDAFGRRTYVRRGFAKRMNVRVFINRLETDTIIRQLADLRDRTALYVGANDIYESLTVFGSYRDFSVDVAYPDKNICSIEIEGVV